MTLNKRYLRNIKENLSFYIASSVLTVVALLLFYLFYIAGSGIKKYGDEFFEKYNLEDATFTTYLEIPDEKISGIEDKYNVTVEKEKVSEKDNKKEDIVLRTVPEAGSSVKLGTGITIYIPEIEYKYPNFTKGYTLDKIKQYCNDHEITLEIVEQTTDSVPAGTILKQSRPEGSVVTAGVKLTITVAIAPVIEDGNESGDITEGN